MALTQTDFTGAGGTGDEQVGHGARSAPHGLAGDVLAEGEAQAELCSFWKGLLFDDLAQGDQADLGVGHFDADVALPGDGGLDADALGGQGQGQVVGQGGDLADADAGAAVAGLDISRARRRTG